MLAGILSEKNGNQNIDMEFDKHLTILLYSELYSPIRRMRSILFQTKLKYLKLRSVNHFGFGLVKTNVVQ